MSKVRQAIRYERQLADAQVQAHRELTDVQLIAAKELLQQAVGYERKYTDGQFGQLNIVAQEHRIFHEREHLLYEDAIEKAATALSTQLAALQTEFDRMREESRDYLTVERFDREHEALSEKTQIALEVMNEKLGNEERVTVRQQTRDELNSGLATNRRWLIGLTVTLVFSLISTTFLIIEHLN